MRDLLLDTVVNTRALQALEVPLQTIQFTGQFVALRAASWSGCLTISR